MSKAKLFLSALAGSIVAIIVAIATGVTEDRSCDPVVIDRRDM